MSKCAQCGQLGAAYSTTVTRAFGLPIVLSQEVMVTPCALESGTASALELDGPENTNHAATPSATTATTTRRVRRGLRDTGEASSRQFRPGFWQSGANRAIATGLQLGNNTCLPRRATAERGEVPRRRRGRLNVNTRCPLRCFAPPPPRSACTGEANGEANLRPPGTGEG